MRLRSSMLALLTAAVFCAPATAPAMQLTVSIDGIFLSGLGLCTDIPAAFGGCIDLATLPIGINPDNGLPYDQVSLAATGPVTVDIAVPGSETFDQPWVFIPGDTGGASYSSDYHFFFDLDRNITISDGIQSITQTIHQQGDIIVGDFEDTFTIHASDPLEFVFNSFAPGQKLLVSMGTATATAGIDPDGTDTGTMSINAIPVPSSLALFGLGFTGLAFRRRRPA